MFPTSSLSGSITIPSDATFWMPKPEDINEDGIGAYFRDTWLIKDVPVREARRLRQKERRIAEVLGHLAANAEDFDRLAYAVEGGYDPDETDEGFHLTATEQAELDEFLSDDETAGLESLELGVAGLVYALATVRIIPAASCRGHPDDRAWSNVPVVLFATTEYRARALQPLVEATNCRFNIDPARPELLAVAGRSILDTMALADAVLESRHTFVQPRPPAILPHLGAQPRLAGHEMRLEDRAQLRHVQAPDGVLLSVGDIGGIEYLLWEGPVGWSPCARVVGREHSHGELFFGRDIKLGSTPSEAPPQTIEVRGSADVRACGDSS